MREEDGKTIRTCYCPLTAVAQYKGLGDYDVGQWQEASESLNLPVWFDDRIIAAADYLDDHEASIRRQLLEACQS